MGNKLCAGVNGQRCTTVVRGSRRCPSCEQLYQQQRNARRPQYDGDWPTVAKAAIAEHRSLRGDVCPGWRRRPHSIDPSDWTCDHDVGPLCRSCNSRKGATADKARRR